MVIEVRVGDGGRGRNVKGRFDRRKDNEVVESHLNSLNRLFLCPTTQFRLKV